AYTASAAMLQHDVEEPEKEFGFEVAPSKKDALYKTGDKIKYDVKVDNPFDVVQEGTVSYRVTTLKDVEVASESIKVNISKHSKDKYTLNIPFQKDPGFYNIAIQINVTEYDDTVKRVFGVNPKEIVSATPAPPDFDKFWSDTRTELRKIDPQFKMIPQPSRSRNGMEVFLVEMKSLGNITVRGWLSMAKNRKPKEKLPIWIVFPGYGVTGADPMIGPPDLAVLTFNFRGEGNSRDVIRPSLEGYITMDLEDKKKYVMRGVIMDCLRSVDFVCSRPELDSTNIMVSGGSMGGYLSIITCSLDKRVRFCSSYNPPFSDWRGLYSRNEWPMNAFVKYSKSKVIPFNKILDNLDYYDLKNFSPKVGARAL
ncbi:MAG: hypothetical protein EOP51_33890, partial [Sphingobacteriales bacterium]